MTPPGGGEQGWAPKWRLRQLLTGTVVSFDGDRGLGRIRPDGGSGGGAAVEIAFHSTSIADGSRCIGVDERVAFLVQPVVGGGVEAAQLARVYEEAAPGPVSDG